MLVSTLLLSSISQVPFPGITINSGNQPNLWGFLQKALYLLVFDCTGPKEDCQKSKQPRTDFNFLIKHVVHNIKDTVMTSLSMPSRSMTTSWTCWRLALPQSTQSFVSWQRQGKILICRKELICSMYPFNNFWRPWPWQTENVLMSARSRMSCKRMISWRTTCTSGLQRSTEWERCAPWPLRSEVFIFIFHLQ